MIPILMSAALVAYNNAANLWRPFHGWAYVPMNLTLAGAVLWFARSVMGLSPAELGLSGAPAPAALAGAGAGAVVVAPAFAALGSARLRRHVADRRIAGLSASRLAYHATVRIPLGTALTEEIVFRSVVYGAWLSSGTVVAITASSLAFGFWHVVPAYNEVAANHPGAGRSRVLAGIAASIVATTAGGVFFVGLRLWTESVAGPAAAHAVINSLGAVAAAAANRKLPADAD